MNLKKYEEILTAKEINEAVLMFDGEERLVIKFLDYLVDVENFVKEKVMKNLIRGIKNVWKWLPIIWKDRDWDYGYMLEILIFKLDNIEKFMRTKGVCASAETIADDIEEVSTIAKRLLNDNYDLVPYWQYSILDNKIDTAFAQNKDTGEIITKREFYDMVHKARDEREKDLDDFVSKFRNMESWRD